MSQTSKSQTSRGATARRYFVGGSDAQIIMGNDEAALQRLWRENEARLSRKNRRRQFGVLSVEDSHAAV